MGYMVTAADETGACGRNVEQSVQDDEGNAGEKEHR